MFEGVGKYGSVMGWDVVWKATKLWKETCILCCFTLRVRTRKPRWRNAPPPSSSAVGYAPIQCLTVRDSQTAGHYCNTSFFLFFAKGDGPLSYQCLSESDANFSSQSIDERWDAIAYISKNSLDESDQGILCIAHGSKESTLCSLLGFVQHLDVPFGTKVVLQ